MLLGVTRSNIQCDGTVCNARPVSVLAGRRDQAMLRGDAL